MYVYGYMRVLLNIWSQRTILSLYHLSSRDQIQLVRLGSKHLHLLNLSTLDILRLKLQFSSQSLVIALAIVKPHSNGAIPILSCLFPAFSMKIPCWRSEAIQLLCIPSFKNKILLEHNCALPCKFIYVLSVSVLQL